MNGAPAALRRIWLCAYYYGLAPGVNAAIRDLIDRERLNATSVMTVAPSFGPAEAAALLRAAKGRAAIGLHVTLTAPFAPGVPGFAPTRGGRFLPVGAALLAGALRRFDRPALAAEVARQFELFEGAFGASPAFVDGHQHVQLFPQLRAAVLEITRARAPGAWVRQCGAPGGAGWLGNPKSVLLQALSGPFRRRARARGLRFNPAFAGAYAFQPEADFARLFPFFLRDLPDGSVVMCHPGFVDPELERLDPLTTLREAEYAFLAGDAFPGALAGAGLALLRPGAAPPRGG